MTAPLPDGHAAATPPLRMDRARFLRRVLDVLRASMPSRSHFDRLPADCGIQNGTQAIALLTGLKRVLGDLPDAAYEDLDARRAMLEAAQDALDAEIEREEEAAEAAEAAEAEARLAKEES